MAAVQSINRNLEHEDATLADEDRRIQGMLQGGAETGGQDVDPEKALEQLSRSMIGGDVTFNIQEEKVMPPPPEKKPSLLKRLVPLVATAALAGLGGAGAMAIVDKVFEKPTPTFNDTDTFTTIGPDKDKPPLDE